MTFAETAISMTGLTAFERETIGATTSLGRLASSVPSASFVLDIRGGGNVQEIAAVLLAFVQSTGERRFDQADTFARLLSAMTPPRTAGRGIAVQAQRNAQARAALEDEFGLLGSADVAKAARTRAKNTASLASRWRKDGRIFPVSGGDGPHLYPGFQFDESGQPLPIIAGVISVLGPLLDGWSLALWFVGSNGWLGGGRPVDVLPDDQVVDAAERLAAEIR